MAEVIEDQGLEALLEYVRDGRGFDLTGYKRSTLGRRIAKRMHTVKADDYAAYQDHLEANGDEFAELFDFVLINVTEFFRDREAWDHLAGEVIPALITARDDDAPIRVWSAGCASGQEAYSVAMLLAEALPDAELAARVKIYATDVDEHALASARLATYTPAEMENVSPERRERFFERVNGRYRLRQELRRAVIFGRNNLISDAPISRVDLLVCRNTLMYFNVEAQNSILERLHFSLRDTGYMLLGRSDTLVTHSGLFRNGDLRNRVFRRAPRATQRDRMLSAGQLALATATAHDAVLRDGAFDQTPVGQMIVDRAGTLVAANQRVRSLFALGPSDIGRPLRDLEVSYRPIELRAAIDRAYQERETISLGSVPWPSGGEERSYEVHIAPVALDGAAPIGATVSFSDATRHLGLERDLSRSKRELELAYEELQSTVEELETTNEELQSTNEELETTNEELQSTNEELETTNEELQSTNEELETMNDEFRTRTTQLDSTNAVLEGVLTSLQTGVAVVDDELRIQVWSDVTEDMWGLRADEVIGRHLLDIDIGLPVERLRGPLRDAMGSGISASDAVPAHDRRGRAVECSVTMLPLGADGSSAGAILLMENALTGER